LIDSDEVRSPMVKVSSELAARLNREITRRTPRPKIRAHEGRDLVT